MTIRNTIRFTQAVWLAIQVSAKILFLSHRWEGGTLVPPLTSGIQRRFSPGFRIPVARFSVAWTALMASAILGWAPAAHAQVSLAAAVDLAVRNSPRVKSSAAEVDKARAAFDETKDVYIPTVSAGANLGQGYGYSPYPPTLFSVTGSSLVYNSSQFSFIRSARAGLEAAQRSLEDTRETVAEDAALTFVALDHDQQREAVLHQEIEISARLLAIVQDRFDAGQDSRIDLTDAKLSDAKLKFAGLRAQQDTANDRMHLARLLGVPPDSLRAEGGFPTAPIAPAAASVGGYANASVTAAFASAHAKQLQANGESHFLYRPQVSFFAQYNRYATFTNSFADLQKQYGANGVTLGANESAFGVGITIPLYDRQKTAKAVESTADATRALHDAEFAQINVLDAQGRLNHSLELLQAQTEVATLEQERAIEQLDIVRAQLTAATTGPPMTPKDEQNARIAEREKYLAVIDNAFQLHQAQISLLRQTGHLEEWLVHSVLPSPGTLSSTPQPHP